MGEARKEVLGEILPCFVFLELHTGHLEIVVLGARWYLALPTVGLWEEVTLGYICTEK